jgi:hypothetical protein
MPISYLTPPPALGTASGRSEDRVDVPVKRRASGVRGAGSQDGVGGQPLARRRRRVLFAGDAVRKGHGGAQPAGVKMTRESYNHDR